MGKKFATLVKSFARDDRGASLVEYAVLIGLIIAVGALAVTNVGTQVKAKFEALYTTLGGV